MTKVETTKKWVEGVLDRLQENLKTVRRRLARPLTLSEKILYGHTVQPERQELQRGKSFLLLQPDRVVMQDVTAQMALLQFMQAGPRQAAVPTSIHCDHLIRAQRGARADMKMALQENFEVYDFLQTSARKYGIGFWKPGSGIIHQVFLENYAFPGGLVIGTDSHTPNAGGLTMIAIGVGGADAAEVMAGLPWEVLGPKVIGIKLTGRLSGWTAPKDVILKICELLTVKGGTNKIIEYFGPGCESISATGKATITNMGAELGATTSIFPYDWRIRDYLKATQREGIADLAEANIPLLTADPDVVATPEKYFDQFFEINLDSLEPYVVGPHSPDVARPISKLRQEAEAQGYQKKIRYALIGSCTNSSYEDMERAAAIAKQALAKGAKTKIPLMVTPGSEQVFETIKRDGQLAALEQIGAKVLANACGPCIGQWKREDVGQGEANSILTSYNRNFPMRNDGNPQTLAFIGSPELVVAMALEGRLDFNPLSDPVETGDDQWFLASPAKADDIPRRGFVRAHEGYVPPAADPDAVQIRVNPKSDRLQLLNPFEKWDGKDFEKLSLLIKAKGKCTTDHISPAGPWLKFRGHLDHISDNMFLGATNAFTGEAGKTRNQLTARYGETPSQVARFYKKKGLRWIVVGDENYGEGSSREHAAMSPRYLGCAAVIVRSFARIHETNLKKQGVLPLTFADSKDFDKVEEEDHISILGLKKLEPGRLVQVILHHRDGKEDRILANHSLSPEQRQWFQAGGALALIRKDTIPD